MGYTAGDLPRGWAWQGKPSIPSTPFGCFLDGHGSIRLMAAAPKCHGWIEAGRQADMTWQGKATVSVVLPPVNCQPRRAEIMETRTWCERFGTFRCLVPPYPNVAIPSVMIVCLPAGAVANIAVVR